MGIHFRVMAARFPAAVPLPALCADSTCTLRSGRDKLRTLTFTASGYPAAAVGIKA